MIALMEEMDLAHAEAAPMERDAEHTLVLLVGCGRASNALAGALRDEGLRALSIEGYDEALGNIERWQPDLVLVGRNPDLGSLGRLFARVHRSAPRALILYLPECQDMEHVMSAVEQGADDVVCPPHSISAILVRQEVLRRFGTRKRQDRKMARRARLGHLTVDLATRQVLDGGRPFSLSGREFELLVRLMEAAGEVVSREELLEDIWGEEQGSEAVLDATVHRLRRKLDEHFHEPELVITVRGIGYRLDLDAIGRTGPVEEPVPL